MSTISSTQEAYEALCNGELFQVGSKLINPEKIVGLEYNSKGEPIFSLEDGSSVTHDRFQEGSAGDLLAEALSFAQRASGQSETLAPPKYYDLSTATEQGATDLSGGLVGDQAHPIISRDGTKAFILSYAGSGTGEFYTATINPASDGQGVSLGNSFQPAKAGRVAGIDGKEGRFYVIVDAFSGGDLIQEWAYTSFSQSGLSFEQEVDISAAGFSTGSAHSLAISERYGRGVLASNGDVVFFDWNGRDLSSISKAGTLTTTNGVNNLTMDGGGRVLHLHSDTYKISTIKLESPWANSVTVPEEQHGRINNRQWDSLDVALDGYIWGQAAVGTVARVNADRKLSTF